jgi:beta-alanine--pyruvate transaminase
LDIYETQGLLTRGAALAAAWREAMHGLKGLPHVVDIRTIGLIAGIEMASRPGAPGARAYDVFVKCFGDGLLIRVTGDIIALSPPLILDQSHIETIAAKLSDAIRKTA